MYINQQGNKVSVEEMQNLAQEAGVSVEVYAKAAGYSLQSEDITKDPEPKIKDGDLLDPNFQQGAAADADAVQQPMTASQAENVAPEDTDLPSVDTSLDSPDPEPNPFSEKYLEFSSGYDKNKKSRIYETDYAQNYAGQTWNKNNRSGTYPDSFEDFAKQFNTELKQDDFGELDEVIIKAKLKSDNPTKIAENKTKELVELRDKITPVSQKTDIGLDYFKLEEKNGELVPKVIRKTSTKDTGNGRDMSNASGNLGYFLNDYETDLKDSLGPEKYEQYKLLETNLDIYNSLLAQSGKQPEALLKSNLSQLFNLEQIDSKTKTNVVNAKKLEETEIFLRGIDDGVKREMNRFLPMSERAREEVEKIRQKRITDAEDYKAKYGVTLVREETIGGRTYTPPDTGILDDKGYEEVFANEEKRLTIDKSVLESDVKNFITEQTSLEKESASYKAKLLSLSNRIKEIDSYAIPSVDLERQRNELVLEYNSILKEDGFQNLVTVNKKLINDQQSLQNRIQNISKNAGDFVEGSAISKTLLKSYELSDRFSQVMEESFLGTSSMLGASLLKGAGDVAMALTEDSKLGNLLNEGDWYDNLVNLKGAAINYNQRLAKRREKYLPANLKASDSSSTMQYIGDMLVNNSPSILVALGTMGGGSLASASRGIMNMRTGVILSGAARARASKFLTNTATSIFFTMEAGGKMSELEIGQKEAQSNINKLKIALASAVGTVEREEILNQIQDQTDLLNLSQLQKSFSSIMYGGIAGFAERTGTLGFMNNFSKLSTSMSQKLISKYGYEGINKAVAKSVGALGTTGIGAGVELLEEGLTLVGQNIVDNQILGQDKSLIEGLDGEFVRNTLATSLAISGPQASQNIYAAISSEVKTNAENKKESEFRDELIDIQNQLNEIDPTTGKKIDGRTKAGKALIDRKKAIIKESALLNAEIVGKMANMSAEDIESVFENNRAMRSKRREAAELGSEFNVNKYAQKRLETLTNEYKAIQEENQSILGKNRKELEAIFKEAQNTPQAVYNMELYEFSKNIAKSTKGVQVLEFATNESGDGRKRFEDYLKNEVKLGNLSQENSNKALEGYDSGANAANIKNNLLIFRDNAVKTFTFNGSLEGSIAAISPMHELGHIQTRKAGIIKDDAVVGDAKVMVDGILTYVKERFEAKSLSKENYDIFNERIKSYKDTEKYTATKGVDADELIQLVSDFTVLGILPKSSFTQLTGTKMFVNSLLKKLNGDSDMFFRINSPNDVFNFIASWQNKAFSFELEGGEDEDDTLKQSKASLQTELNTLKENEFDYDPEQFQSLVSNLETKIRIAGKKEAAKPKPKTLGFDTSEASVIGQINNLVPKDITTNKEYKENKKVQNEIDKAFKPNGIISNIIKGRFGGGDLFIETLNSVKNRAVRYDPAAERKKAGNNDPVTFAEFIFSNVNFSKLDAAKKLAIKAADQKKKTDLDNKEAQSKTTEEDSGSTADTRKKYASLISNTKIIPSFVLTEIKTKLADVVSKLTSKLSTRPKGKNKQTTPLIEEIKKAIGKVVGDATALPKQIINRMGNPKDGSYQKFLIDNKKSILENMTTTYLMTAIPAAVEKSVGGAYVLDKNGKRKKDSNGNDIFKPKFVPYPEWVGKEIDREKVSTNKKGGTSGNQIVRRAIQVEVDGKFEDSITDKDFVANFVGSDGKVIRGKRESLGKAIAEEAGFEVLTKELANEKSDIRKAFKKNQAALKETLVDNFVQQISRDAERGTVKFSKTAIKLKINQEMAKALASDDFRNMLVANIEISERGGRPFYSTIIDYFDEFPGIKNKTILKQIARELSSNYTSPIFGEIGIERIVDVEGLEKTIDYLLTASEESLTQGDSYPTIQLLLESEDINLDEKTLEGLNAGRAAAKKIIDKLVEKGFTGNEIKNIFTAIYSPSGFGGFKGKLNPDGKTRSIPKSSVLTEDDLGIKYEKVNKKTGRLDRQSYGSFMINVADFEQNFLKGIEMGPKVSTRTDAFTKNFYTDSSRPYNKKLNNESRKDFLQGLQNDKEKYVKDLLTYIEAVRESGISPAAVRTFIRAPFASMDGLGKIASTPRWMPAKMDGTLLSFKELVKIFGRTDGKVDKGVFEHTKPANRVALSAFRYALTGKKSDLNVLKLELEDFDTAFITEKMDADLRRNKLQSLMGLNYVRGEGVMNTRYLEMVQKMNDAGITFYDAKTNELLSPVGVFGKELNQEMEAGLKPIKTDQKAINKGISLKFSKSPKKIRVFDFDDTLARTKSNVLYTMPGEVRIFHGGDIKSVKDIDGFVYFSEDQKQASAYAKGNQGDVSSFKINETSLATEDQVFDVINALGIKPRAGYEVDESSLYELIDPRFEQSFSKKDLEKLAVALKRKGIKAARFTDTNISQGKNEGRETENIAVFDKKAVQEQSKLTAAEFAAKSDEMAAKGADFDFIEFSKVMNGKEGPLLEVAKIIAEKRGTEDLFVLTARPQDAAGSIQKFLAELGLDIPLKNITGLADGNPKAKADWMISKVAEGYNDFYFADDASKNVKAVKNALAPLDVKSKVQLAKVKFSMSTSQKLTWKDTDEALVAKFKVGTRNYEVTLEETAFMEFDEGQTYQDIEDIAKELGISEDKDGDGIESSERFFHLEFGDTELGKGITGEGNAFKVFGTAINGVADYINKKKKIEGVIFTAKEPSRIRLYKTLSRALAEKINGSFSFKNNTFIVSKNPPVSDNISNQPKQVQNVFNTFDVKGKVQQAKVKFSKGLDKGFNDMIERQTGTESFKEFSKGVAQRRGKKVGKFKIFVSPSAEDFRGLTQYKFAGKGKQGEADQKFFEEALMDPYFKGVAAVEAARETIKNDTKALFKIFKPVKKKLNKLVPGIDFTYDGAVRVYLWNKAGIEIPGLTKRDNKKLNDAIANDPELSAFADALLLVSKQDTWPAPGEYWEAKTTLSDLNTLTEKTNRKEYLAEFIENVDIIFSEKNLNKVEALYGKASRTAIENAIYAMKTGSNSPNQNGDGITNRWLKWVNNSIGTIMFFNRRSALLQLTSATNFLNWSDNNPAKAALAFANQPQYWKDWAMIFNSDKLKQRRSGLKSDVQESEIANAAKNTEDKIGSIIAYLLKIGFSPTQIADSIAISSGGATFYRNRVNTYKKQGLDVKEAETKAFEDMSKLSDEAQQSGDPALVSQQQRSVAGRLILSFQNTTMQYTRLMKKAGQDLINGRGDAKTHVSKILYYGALQNFIFNALSQTAFALIPGFDEEEEEDKVKRDEKLEEKASRVLNGMTDSIIRGTGIYGAVVTTLKNTFNTWEREADKGFKGDQAKTILEAANISPAIGSKLRKIYSAIQAYQFDKAVMEKHPWSVTIDGKFNPSATYSVIGNVASATLNIPLDRALAEARGVAEMFDNRNSEMQRIALALGWRTWNVGAKNEEFDLIKMEAKQAKKDKKAEEKAQYKAYLKRVGSKLSLEEANAYRRIKSAKLKKEYILKIGEEKGIK